MRAEETKINPFAEDLNFAYAETVGQRSGQEDYCLFKSYSVASGPKLLAILADGMGGHAAGARASRMAVEAFLKSFSSANEEQGRIKSALSNAIKESNIYIEGAQSANPELEGMGCTLVGLYLEGHSFYWVSVGDSPLYLFRNGRLKRINEDHSMAPLIASALAKGNLTEEEAQNYPNKNALRSAIMGKPVELVDLSDEHLLQEGDVLILASDGLLTLSESEIEAEISNAPHRNAKDFAARLLQAVIAKNKPRQDNTTIMVIAPGKSLFAGRPVRNSARHDDRSEATVKKSPMLMMISVLLAVLLLATAMGAYLAYSNRISLDSIVQSLTGKPAAQTEKTEKPKPVEPEATPVPPASPSSASESSSDPGASNTAPAEPPSMKPPAAKPSQGSKHSPDTSISAPNKNQPQEAEPPADAKK